jgi:peptidoglycan/LPS O-acetylase OafA/YrhL
MMELYAPSIMIAFESFNWMIAILGYSAKYLNQPSKRLGYLSAAVYPIYIIHMPIQYFFSLYILPLPISALIKFTLLVLCIFGVSFTIYESMIRRINLLRPLFGLKLKGS